MHVTRYIRVWITQGHEHQVAGIIGTLQSLLPQPSVPKLDEMLPVDREGEGGFLPVSRAMSLTEMGKVGPSSLGHIYREGSI